MGVVYSAAAAIASWVSGNAIAAFAVKTAFAIAASYAAQKLQKVPGASRAGRTQNVRSSTFPHQIVYGRIRKGGMICFINGTGLDNKYLHLVVVVAAHECQSFESFWFEGTQTLIDETGNAIGTLKDFAEVHYKLGADNQLALPAIVANNANWTQSHRLRGRAYFYVKLTESVDKFPSFIPPVTVEIRGHNHVFDPRTGNASWSDNPALICADILERYLGVERSRIDLVSLIEAANICDETVCRNDDTPEKRYICGGFFELSGGAEDWLSPIINSMAGFVGEYGGIYYIHAGAWRAPVVTITDDDLVGQLTFRTAESDWTRANTAKGTFVSPEVSYDQPTDFPPYEDQDAIAEDGGVVNFLELDLEFCPSYSQAQRLAKIALRENREDETVSLVANLQKGLDVKQWDTVMLDLNVLELSGTFRVVEHGINIAPEGVTVSLTLKKHTESVYEWDASEEKTMKRAVSNVPGLNNIEPREVTYIPTFNSTNANHIPATIQVLWTDPPLSPYPQTIEAEIAISYEYRAVGSSTWIAATLEDSADIALGLGTWTKSLSDSITSGTGFEFQNIVVTTARVRNRMLLVIVPGDNIYEKTEWVNALLFVP